MNSNRKKNTNVRLLLIVALVTLGILVSRNHDAFGQSLKPAILSLSSPKEISAAPMLFARYLGYFKKEGNDRETGHHVVRHCHERTTNG